MLDTMEEKLREFKEWLDEYWPELEETSNETIDNVRYKFKEILGQGTDKVC